MGILGRIGRLMGKQLGKFLLLDARGIIPDSIIGVVAGMLYAGSRQKPILALSLEAGYASASIRERIYAREPGPGGAMAGMAISTE